MATATDPVLKRRKKKEEEQQQKDQHLLLPNERENKVNNEEKEALDLILLKLQSPNWLNLPSDLSRSILSRISSSIPDLFSFSAVCNPWRSLAKSSPNSVSPPPLLLSPLTDDYYYPKRSSMSKLEHLTPDLDPRTFNSPISKRALNRNCCGCSFGHLIFASSSRSNVLIADLFSSAEYRLPQPPPGHYHFRDGILTAPPSSSSSMLFLISYGHALCWRLGGDPDPDDEKDWTDWLVVGLGSSDLFESATVFDGKLHVVHIRGELFSLEFVPHVHWKRLPDAPYAKLVLPHKNKPYHTRLVECDGELLMVCFMSTGYFETNRMEVYRVDPGEGVVWVRVESIGDWCVFMDFIGRCPLARRNPGRWGGKSNYIYYAGPEYGRWSLLPLDGTEFEHDFEFWCCYEDRWPSPIWAYPTDICGCSLLELTFPRISGFISCMGSSTTAMASQSDKLV